MGSMTTQHYTGVQEENVMQDWAEKLSVLLVTQ